MVIDIKLHSFFPEMEDQDNNTGKKEVKPEYSADGIANRCQTVDYRFDSEDLRTDCFRASANKPKKIIH